MAPGPATDVADLLTQAAAEDPDRLAIVESGGRRVTWGGFEDEGGRIATGFWAARVLRGPPGSGGARHRRRPPGDGGARQPDRVRVVLPRRAADPGRRRSREPDLAARGAGADDRGLGLPDDLRRRRHGDRRAGGRPGPRAGEVDRVPRGLDRG